MNPLTALKWWYGTKSPYRFGKPMNPAATVGFWSMSPWYAAAVLHILAGAAFAWGVRQLFPAHFWLDVWIWVGATAVKEFVIDLSPFESDTVWGSIEDFLFYMVGTWAAILSLGHPWAGLGVGTGAILFVFAVDLYRNARWDMILPFRWSKS